MSFEVGDLVQVLHAFSTDTIQLTMSASVKDAAATYKCWDDYSIIGSKLNAQIGEVQFIINNNAVVVYLLSLRAYRRFHNDSLQVINV